MTKLVPNFQLNVKMTEPRTPDRMSLESIDITTPQSETAAAATTLANLGTDTALDTPMAPTAQHITQETSPSTSTETADSTDTAVDTTPCGTIGGILRRTLSPSTILGPPGRGRSIPIPRRNKDRTGKVASTRTTAQELRS